MSFYNRETQSTFIYPMIYPCLRRVKEIIIYVIINYNNKIVFRKEIREKSFATLKLMNENDLNENSFRAF